MTPYELWQYNRYGNVLPERINIGFYNPPRIEDYEDNYEEDLRLAEFMETMNELQRMEDEN